MYLGCVGEAGKAAMNRNYILTARKRLPGIQNFTQAKEWVEQQDLVITSVVPSFVLYS